jgi:hypothetical protein
MPAIVDIIPVETVTLRTQKLLESAMYTLPDESSAIPYGSFNAANIAGPSSPL